MATATTPTSVDLLTAVDRAFIVGALELKVASLERSMRSESNADIKAFRQVEINTVNALIARFR